LTNALSQEKEFLEALSHIKIIDGPNVSVTVQKKEIDIVFGYMQKNWASVKARLPKMTSTQQGAILAIAMDKMNDVEYLNFTLEIIDEIVKGNLTVANVGQEILMPNQTKEFFPAINYKDQRLVLSLKKLDDILKNQNRMDLSNYVDMILDGDAYASAQVDYERAGMAMAPSVEQLRRVGKNNRWDWTAADAVAINTVTKAYGNGPDSWKMEGASQWFLVFMALVILSGLGVVIYRKVGSNGRNAT
jgi:hypothetical protein